MLDPKLVEQIDACRPGSRDIEQPELAGLANLLATDSQVRAAYATVQRLDAQVGLAMHEVPVPEGLASRILNRLESSPHSSGRAAALAVDAAVHSRLPSADSQAVELNVPSSTAVASAEGVSRGRWTRRRLIAGGSLLAASVLLTMGLVRFNWQNESSQIAVTEKAGGWYDSLGDGWQSVAKMPQAFSVPSGIGGPVRGWQWVSKTVARSGVVYDLGQGQPGSAVLFVLKAVRPDLPTMAPRSPQSTTAGLAIGAWQSGGLMYVLVVRGDERAYKKLFHPVPPLA